MSPFDIIARLERSPAAWVCIRREAADEIRKLRAEIERIKDASCTGCINAPAKDGEPYEEECMGCRRFYADYYATEENTK